MLRKGCIFVLLSFLLLNCNSVSYGARASFEELNQRKKQERLEKREHINFTDVSNHWAKDDILHIAKLGIIDGYSDNKFYPNNNVTRGEAAKLIAMTYGHRRGVGYGGDQVLLDIKDTWYESYVNGLGRFEAIPPTFGELFRGDTFITRSETAYIIANCMEEDKYPEIKEVTEYSDLSKEYWGFEEIVRLSKIGVMQGDNNRFKPDDKITRAELATILARSLEIYDSIDYD